MASSPGDRAFTGSIPELYDQYLVPLIFEPYAIDLVNRAASRPLSRVLEVAAGTGVVTRKLASALPPSVAIVATDLNQAMLDRAAAVGTSRPVEWRQADASRLPFPDGHFDAVICQFGVMFFPDKAAAFAEALRVLGPGGLFLFNAWDRLETNELTDAVCAGVATVFPADPPSFMARLPHGYHDPERIRQDLLLGGFHAAPTITTVKARSRAASPRIPALAVCHGSPLRNEIEARDPSLLDRATDAGAEEVARRFGPGPVDGQLQALVIAVDAPRLT
jgi:SAM-dependent methyltransferase